jgi:hypothetical protein
MEKDLLFHMSVVANGCKEENTAPKKLIKV